MCEENDPTVAPLDTPADLYDASLAALRQLARSCAPRVPPPDTWPVWADKIAQVLAANLASGRFHVAQDDIAVPHDAAGAWRDYAHRVAQHYLAEESRLAQLQSGDRDAWAAVIKWLERMAYRWYGPIGREEWAAWSSGRGGMIRCGR